MYGKEDIKTFAKSVALKNGKPLAAAIPTGNLRESRIEIFWKHNLVVETHLSKGEVQRWGI